MANISFFSIGFTLGSIIISLLELEFELDFSSFESSLIRELNLSLCNLLFGGGLIC